MKPQPLVDDGDYVTVRMQEDHVMYCQGKEFCVHGYSRWRKHKNWGIKDNWLAPQPDDTEELYWRRITEGMTADEIRSEILPHVRGSSHTLWNRPLSWITYLIKEKEQIQERQKL